MVVKIRFRYSLLLYYCKFWILDFGFWIGGIASLYLLLKQAEHLKSKIRIPKFKIHKWFIIFTTSCLKQNEFMTIAGSAPICT